MKLYTAVDIPDEDYEWSKKWVIDIDGDIGYWDEDDGCWVLYRLSKSDYELKPLPNYEKETGYQYSGNPDELMPYNTGLVNGYNACLNEIVGE